MSPFNDIAAAEFARKVEEHDRRRVYVPSPEPEIAPIWTVDRVGEFFATVTIFAMIALVGFASCWEVSQ
jgi:hypothetical protein